MKIDNRKVRHASSGLCIRLSIINFAASGRNNTASKFNCLSIHTVTDFQLWGKGALFIYDGDGETVINSYVSSVSAGF